MKRLLLILLYTQFIGCSLSSLEQYASSLPESPILTYPTFELHPDYSLWRYQHQDSLLTRMLTRLGLRNKAWTPALFSKELANVGHQMMQPHTLALQPNEGTKIIIIGPLYGSYHSLIRILRQLQKQGLLNEQLALTQKDTYLIFTGDTINGSPYNLEILTLILQLMRINTPKVIYLAGMQEKKDIWMGLGLRAEFNQRIGEPDKLSLLQTFFNSLPTALTIRDAEDAIIIGSEESACVPSGLTPQTLTLCPLGNAQQEIPFTAVLSNEHRIMNYSSHKGLAQAPSEFGALTWAVFSAPNSVYQKFYDFTYDAFTILTIGPTLAQSIITLFAQKVPQKSGFVKVARYSVFTGKSLDGVQMKSDNPLIPSAEAQKALKDCLTIPDSAFIEKSAGEKKPPLYLGCSLDLTKGASPLGRHLRDGITLRVQEVNQKGGIHGRLLKVVFMDDGYSPVQAKANVEYFMKKYKSNLFIANLGSPTLAFYRDMLEQQKIFLFFPSTGAPLFRTPDMKGVVHWRASFTSEGKAVTKFVHEHYGIDSIAFLYQDDAFGRGALAGGQEIVPKATTIPYERNITSFKEQLQKLKSSISQGIGFFSTSLAAIEFIRQAGVEFFIGKKLFGLSDLAEESFKKFARSRGLSVITAQFAPNPEDPSLQLAEDFQKALKKQGGAAGNVFMFEGYISASLTCYILEMAQELTPPGINEALKTIKQESYKGLPLSFNPENRELAQLLWIDTGTPPWIKQEVA